MESNGQLAKRPRIEYYSSRDGHGQILSQEYVDHQLHKRSSEPEKPNHILLLTVLNPLYPITCNILHTICNPHGPVIRIVIFKKNGVQALVEFLDVKTAQNARESLHGCDIYCGCCTLKVEYGKPSRLNVYKNDKDSWDYTKCGDHLSSSASRPVLLKEPPILSTTNINSNYNNNNNHNNILYNNNNNNNNNYNNNNNNNNNNNLIKNGGDSLNIENSVLSSKQHLDVSSTLVLSSSNALLGVSPSSPSSILSASYFGSPVVMVYGLNSEKMNVIRLFNLFCLYGNVMRIKFLKTKNGCSMVQMGDGLAAERVICNLNNAVFLGSKMQVGFSKQAFLADVQSPFTLSDGSYSFKDFMGSKNNRFINAEMASKNRIQSPSRIVHFFNAPPDLESSQVEKLLDDSGAPKATDIKMFPSKTERSSSGLLEFNSISDALEAIVFCNHSPIPNPNGKFPYILKLCFSSTRSLSRSSERSPK